MNWSTWGKPTYPSMTVLWDDKAHHIEYYAVGDLGVVVGSDPYCVVHIPTRSMFDKAIPSGDYSETELIEWCKIIQTICLDHWEALKNFPSGDYTNDANVIARGVILAHARGTKVPTK